MALAIFNGPRFDPSRIYSKAEAAVIVDAGACCGEYSRWLRDVQAYCGKLYMFEPAHNNLSDLASIVDDRTFLIPYALIGRGGWVVNDFAEYKESREMESVGNLWGRIDSISIEEPTIYSVPAVPINEIFQFLRIPQIDYLKMDIEGLEGDVINAMSHNTAKRIKQMSIEIHPKVSPDQIMETLKSLGYTTAMFVQDEIGIVEGDSEILECYAYMS